LWSLLKLSGTTGLRQFGLQVEIKIESKSWIGDEEWGQGGGPWATGGAGGFCNWVRTCSMVLFIQKITPQVSACLAFRSASLSLVCRWL